MAEAKWLCEPYGSFGYLWLKLEGNPFWGTYWIDDGNRGDIIEARHSPGGVVKARWKSKTSPNSGLMAFWIGHSKIQGQWQTPHGTMGGIFKGKLVLGNVPAFYSSASPVASMEISEKLLDAAQRATYKLPADMQDSFAQLFTPANLAILTGVLAAWAASHAYGVGFVADAGLLFMGVLAMGTMAFQAAALLRDYVITAADAQDEHDLEKASRYLAECVALIGVAVFIAVIFKAAGRAVPKIARYGGRTVEQWLQVLGKPGAPALVRGRLETALKFFQEYLPALKDLEKIRGFLRGIDFSKNVRMTNLTKGTELIGYKDPSNPYTLFFTKVGTGMDRLAVSTKGRQFFRYVVESEAPVLESFASGMVDTWTTAGVKELVSGGGIQYIIPNASKVLKLLSL